MQRIINFAPTGIIPTKKMTPFVPLSIDEIVEDVHKAYIQGITIVHLHIRDEEQHPTLNAKLYGTLISKIRRYAPELLICVSLSARNQESFEKRVEPLYLQGDEKPDMASLTLSSMNFTNSSSINNPEDIEALAHIMHEQSIIPELEIFDVGMLNYAKYLISKNILSPTNYFNLMLGNIASAQASLLHAGMLLQELPENSFWSFGGIGNASIKAHHMAMAMDGGIRVGLEDNIWLDEQRKVLASNQELLQRTHKLLELHSQNVMQGSTLRDKILKANQ